MIWEILNPILWLSVAWLIFDAEVVLLLRKRRIVWPPSWGPLSLALLFVLVSIPVALKMSLDDTGMDNGYMWYLQFEYMPIPPSGCDGDPGISNPLEWVFLFAYPLINGLLGFFGFYTIRHGFIHGAGWWQRLSLVAVLGLILAKILFEIHILTGLDIVYGIYSFLVE